MTNGPGAMQQAVAERRTQVGGDWFFWIAGFSIISSVLAAAGTQFHFALGLGTTALIDASMNGFGPGSIAVGKGPAIALELFISAFYVLYGFFARKGAIWAFIVGAIFYALDGVLLLTFQSWIAAAFHAYALYRIFGGFQAAQQLNLLRRQQASFGNSGSMPPSNDVWPPPPSI